MSSSEKKGPKGAPHKPQKVPSYRLHKPTGQAVVTLSGRDHYLGLHGTPESVEAYNRKVAEWLAAGRTEPCERAPDVTVSELLAAYWSHAEGYYRGPDGLPTGQLDRVKRSLAPARELYGSVQARRFGPGELRAVRTHMVGKGWCRRVVNQRVGCLVRAFRWAVSDGLIGVEVWQSLKAVEGLKAGRTEAPESEPVEPVPEADIEPVLALLPSPLPDVARLQLHSAARPGEALAVRACEIDATGEVWVCRRARHKTAWRGHRRTLYFGPRAQEVVRSYLVRTCPLCGVKDRAYRLAFRGGLCGVCADRCDELGAMAPCGPWPELFDLGDYYLFSPKEAREDRHARMRAARKTKVQPSQASRRKVRPRKQPGDRYRVTSYSAAVLKACERAGVPNWTAHQLRHNAATAIVAAFGWDAARIVLGQRTLDAVRIYGEDDRETAMKAVAELG